MVIETLATYVRFQSIENHEEQEKTAKEEEGHMDEKSEPPTDIQAAFTVLGRRFEWDKEYRNYTVDLNGAYLAGIKGKGLHFEGAAFNFAHMEKAIFETCSFDGGAFRGAMLPAARFIGACSCNQTDFYGATLDNALLANIEGSGAIFQLASCRNIIFSKAKLQQTSFVGAQCQDADFYNVDMTGADCRQGRFERAGFRPSSYSVTGIITEHTRAAAAEAAKTNLARANFYKASLTDAQFQSVICEETNFAGAFLDGIRPFDVTFKESKMEGAYYRILGGWYNRLLTREQLDTMINLDDWAATLEENIPAERLEDLKQHVEPENTFWDGDEGKPEWGFEAESRRLDASPPVAQQRLTGEQLFEVIRYMKFRRPSER